MKDKIIHGTSGRGDSNGNSVLTESQVEEILGIKNQSATKIAKRYGVSYYTIYDIKSKRTWAWLNANTETQTNQESGTS